MLILSHNPLGTLPDSFGQLENLRILQADSVQLTALPDSFGSLRRLETLHLAHNKIAVLPESFGHLVNLQTLEMTGNAVTTLPDSFGNLTRLETLHLKFNGLTALPENFCVESCPRCRIRRGSFVLGVEPTLALSGVATGTEGILWQHLRTIKHNFTFRYTKCGGKRGCARVAIGSLRTTLSKVWKMQCESPHRARRTARWP